MSRYAECYVCDDCGAEFDLQSLENLCRLCGGLLEVRYDLDAVADPHALISSGRGMWRWGQLLPLPAEASIVTLGEGDSPLLEMPTLSSEVGVRQLFVKNDSLMPTGSFKDRGYSLAVSFAKHLGLDSAFTYSSGNAGASFAAYCARSGIDATVFVEDVANEAKRALISLHGANVYQLKYQSSKEIFDAVTGLSSAGQYSFVNFINPIRHEAMKVCAYEICESLDWKAPDVVVHPVGTGGGLWGTWKGFCELRVLGLIDKLPRMIGVQPKVCAPLVEAFVSGKSSTTATGDASQTMAQSIAGDDMIQGGKRPLRAIRESNGTAVAVSEDSIARAMTDLGAAAVGVEPSAAVSYAALTEGIRDGWLSADDRAVAVVTGVALKQPSVLVDVTPSIKGLVAARTSEMLKVLNEGVES